MCVLRPDSWHVFDNNHIRVDAPVHRIDWEIGDAEKGRFEHYMLKEIYEQPEALENAMRGRLSDEDASAHFGGLNLDARQLRRAERFIFTACGTSYHAALVGEYLFEEFARIPVEVEYATEFRYRNPPMDRNTIVLAITQSGETADTLAALRESKRKGHHTLALCNVVGSTIAREADGGVYLHAGPGDRRRQHQGVHQPGCRAADAGPVHGPDAASVEHQRPADHRGNPRAARRDPPDAPVPRPGAHDRAELSTASATCSTWAGSISFPVALEGALKLKEISYIHAEGYPAAEMKHGPIALVDEDTPSVFLIPAGGVIDKVMSNLEEIKARGGPVIAIACEGDDEMSRHIEDRADEVIFVPQVPEYLQPLVSVVPLQLLAYHIALLRGCDVDKPRNLAKSVTVE